MNRSKVKDRERQARNRIARAIFAAAEASGIASRELAEQLTDNVLHRLEQRQAGMRPLPGLEELSPPPPSRPPTEAEIRALVQQALAEKSQATPVKPAKPEEKRPMPPAETATSLTANALAVLERRYLRKDDQGRPMETPEDMLRRVAGNIAQAELLHDPQADVQGWAQEFYRVMTSLEFLPNSPTLMNAGRPLQQLSACFVLPVEDSMESIFDAVKYTALIHKSGGGTGFSFSRLRPEGDFVGSTSGVASGPVSFMRAFDVVTDVTKQGGTRRGANMGILEVHHPDIIKFIRAKEDGRSFQNFNISVAVTEDFMRAVEADGEYNLVNPRTKQVAGRLRAKEVFDLMVDLAWRTGDPGIVFLDRVNEANPTPALGRIESTNPCGEQPLLPYESCNLGSINLARLWRVSASGGEDGQPGIDWERLEELVKLAMRFLDNVIDMNHYPLPQIEEMTRKNRKVGLGVMGFADLLVQLGIPYDSEEALRTGERLMQFISEKAAEASVALARKRGAFPTFKGSIHDRKGQPQVRNATRTTIAPTGTISIIAGCSSGIEPYFALAFVRHVMDNDELSEVNPYFEAVAKREGFYSEELMKRLAREGSLRAIDGIPEQVKRLFVTAHDISPEWHVRMQAAFQKYTDNAVSKTVNFPHDATREDVARVFMLAYREGCKGITIYRDRSKDRQVLTVSREEETATLEAPARVKEVQTVAPRERPKRTVGLTEKVSTGCGNLYVTVNRDEQGIFEVFSALGKAGGCAAAQLEASSRLISLALRAGVEPSAIVNQLRGIRCPALSWENGHAILSCPDAIGGVLGLESGALEEGKGELNPAGQCPECSSPLAYQEGCLICRSCGYTKCG